MEKELIINSTAAEVEIALLEDSRLVELHKEGRNSDFSVGDIYLGTVRKIRPDLNAAFVNIKHKRDAFLHFTDLSPKIKSLIKYTNLVRGGKYTTHKLDNFELEPDNDKRGKIDDVFKKSDFVLTQIIKKAISTKGPRLSCEITLPGRYMVLVPFSNTVSVSKKISNTAERKRLKVLVDSIKPHNFGVIIRTASEGKKVADMHGEISTLMKRWEQLYQQLAKSIGPVRILSEIDKTTTILRDMLNDSFNSIVVNDDDTYNSIKKYLEQITPENVKRLKHYKSTKPIFDHYNITKQIKSAFGLTYTMRSGAYIIMEETEAMHVVDVNSGPKFKARDQETSAITVNLESAKELARQFRLRDMGGLIVIDFIDMKKAANKALLVKSMREFMANDRAQHSILALSKFGLMQITRQRVKPALKISTAETCPSCLGTGKVEPSILITDTIERDLEYILKSQSHKKLHLNVHPFVAAYLVKNFRKQQRTWYFKYSCWVKITEDNNLSIDKYKFYNTNDDELRL